MGDEKNLTPDPSAGGEKAGGLEGNGGNPFAEAALPRFDEAVVEAGTSGPASDFLATGAGGAFDAPTTEAAAEPIIGAGGPELTGGSTTPTTPPSTEGGTAWDRILARQNSGETAAQIAANQKALRESPTPIGTAEGPVGVDAIPASMREAKDEFDSTDTQGKLLLLQNTASRARELGMNDPKPATDTLTAIRTGSMTPEQFRALDPNIQKAVEPGLTKKQASLYATDSQKPGPEAEVASDSIVVTETASTTSEAATAAPAAEVPSEEAAAEEKPAAAVEEGDGDGNPPNRPVAESAGDNPEEKHSDPLAVEAEESQLGDSAAGEEAAGAQSDLSRLEVTDLSNDQVKSELARLREAEHTGPLSETDQQRLDSLTAIAENIDRNAEGFDALINKRRPAGEGDSTLMPSAEGVDSGAAAVEPGAAAVDLAELTTRRDELEDQILSVTDPAEKDRINQELTSIDEQINNLQAATIEPEAAAVEPKRSARERALDFGLTEDEAHDMENIGDPTLRKPFSELTDVQKEFARQNLTDEEYQEYIKLTPSEMNDRLGLSTANGFPEAQPTPSDMRRGESKEQYEARKVAEAEAHEAREKEIFAGMTPEDIEAKKNEIRENWDKGASVTWTEKDAQIASHLGLEPTANEKNDISFVQNRMNEGATDLTDHEKYVRDKFGLKEKLDTTQEARQMERIEFAIRNGTASTEEIAKYNEYKNRQATDSKDVDIRNQLRDKLARVGLTKEEEAKLIQLEQSTKGTETPAQIEAQRKKEIENIATSIMLKFSRGEEPTPEEVALFQRLFAEQKMTEAGFTPEQARVAAREALKLESGKSQRESRRTREANEDMKKLMAFNLRLISQRNLAEQLNTKRKEVIEEAKAARSAAESAEPQDRMRLKGVEYGKYRQILSYNDQLAGTKYAAQRINAERIDLEQRVRRKTGVTGGVHAFGEWCGAKIKNTITEITILAEEELPFGGISIPGSIQRGIISKGGYS